MRVKLLQLNIFQGKHTSSLLLFLKKTRYNLLSFQEVVDRKYRYKNVIGKPSSPQIKKLGYRNEYLPFLRIADAKLGNAIFWDENFKPLAKKNIWLKKPRERVRIDNFRDDSKFPRAALSVLLERNGFKFYLISSHLARGVRASGDSPLKLKHARKLVKYLKTLKHPFILTGDFNMTPDTKTVKIFSPAAKNLTTGYKIKNTLNPRLHYAQHLFPRGLAVDYVFVSPGIRVKKFRPIRNPDLSDHLGLALEFEI